MRRDRGRRGRAAAGGALFALALAAGAAPGAAQQTGGEAARRLSLDEALRIAEEQSEQVLIARAGVTRARGQLLQARSRYFPQVSASASYARTLASEFESFSGGTGTDTTSAPPPENCGRFTPDPTLPLAERVDSLERGVECLQDDGFGGIDFGNLPFGRENVWRYGLTLQQNLFAGGRIRAANRIADAGRDLAGIELESTRAQLALDVTQAYYDAALSDRLVGIAEATLEQSERTLRQARLGVEAGTLPEFELLRARVQRDNQRPVVIDRRATRDLAYLRLKQLLDVPAEQPLALTTELDETEFGEAELAELAELVAEERAPVRQAEEAVEIQENQVRIARGQRLPSLVLSSDWGRVGYPSGVAPSLDDFNTNWTVTAALSLPVFTGGRIRGEVLVAEADLLESRARLQQVRELARLDAQDALERLRAALASWEASEGTVEQAQRAYRIAEVRYDEGISTQVELADARLLLQQAEANRALAARDLRVARARVRLLPDLPLRAGGGGAATQTQPSQQQQQQPATQQGAGTLTQSGTPGASFR